MMGNFDLDIIDLDNKLKDDGYVVIVFPKSAKRYIDIFCLMAYNLYYWVTYNHTKEIRKVV